MSCGGEYAVTVCRVTVYTLYGTSGGKGARTGLPARVQWHSDKTCLQTTSVLRVFYGSFPLLLEAPPALCLPGQGEGSG